MGYDTTFSGSFYFNKEVSPQLKEYINRFSATRRMARDNDKIKAIYPNWRELCFFGELGNKGEYFAPISRCYGQENDGTCINDSVHPGYWCQWVIDDNNELVWDEGEKFYNYVDWLEYLIKHFFAPNGYVLNGEVEFQGEEYDDFGTITVTDNAVEITYGERIMSLGDIDDYKLIKELESRGYAVNK